MSGIQMALLSSGDGRLDTQTVTVGTSGTAGAQDRLRGYSSFGPLGSISDGTSNIYAGATITALEWIEIGPAGAGYYYLVITGATNTGWTSMVIGTDTLLRASASYTSGSWSWFGYTIGAQQFGNTAGVVVPVYFY
jgi:hypothetical protein